MNYKLLLGSHVKMSAKSHYLLGAVKQALSYQANALMIYTGAPQNTIRVNTNKMYINEAHKLMQASKIKQKALIIHAPYILNLANSDPKKRSFAIKFLKDEYLRAHKIGAKYLVLHPGNHLQASPRQAIKWISEGLNEIIDPQTGVSIALETMAGKGSEVGKSFGELKQIIDGVNYQNLIGVCFDTCHVHDAGYDIVNNFDKVLEEFKKTIGLEKLLVMHINDSKNPCGGAKDRHENIGYGYIGWKALLNIVWHPKLSGVIKILETPYNNGFAPYKEEISMLQRKKFNLKIQGRQDVKIQR